MIISRIACDNFYMFKDFTLDLTYEKAIKHSLADGDILFKGSKIKVRKNLILLGANASGKTTFGKLLCMILNFVHGKSLDGDDFKFSEAQYDKKCDSYFEIEFIVDDVAYLVKAHFRNSSLQHEEVRQLKIRPSYNVKKLREKLVSSEPLSLYDADDQKLNIGFKSFAFSVSKSEKLKDIQDKITFWFLFSTPISRTTQHFTEVDISFLNKLITVVDNSIKDIKRLCAEGEDKPTNSYQIRFKNGEIVTVPNGNLNICGARLSHGTFETIDFIFSLSALMKGSTSLLYIDERLSHMHSELEAYLVRQAFLKKPLNAQIFFTTHDTELLDLNIPVTSYIAFRRNNEGFNDTVRLSDKMNKNDRHVKHYYENDYFGVLPDYSVLDKVFSTER